MSELSALSFQALLRAYLPPDLLRREMERPSLLDLIPRDDSWSGGFVPIPLVFGPPRRPDIWDLQDDEPPEMTLGVAKIAAFDDEVDRALKEFQG